jgi:Fe-S cluster assembly ATPase SufC
MKADEYRAMVTGRKFTKDGAKRPKYRNEKQYVDGIWFDSKRESSRYLELKVAENAGAIRGLKLQYVYPIVIDGVRVCDYVADFVYEERNGNAWTRVTEDAKGMRTEVYRLKKKLMRAVHGIEIRET